MAIVLAWRSSLQFLYSCIVLVALQFNILAKHEKVVFNAVVVGSNPTPDEG
jgi:hypothetical protein